MLKVSELQKIYKLNKKQMTKQKVTEKTRIAVNDITFEAKKGEIFGLLGPNGAGKTTTLRCIATLYKPTKGSITVNGIDVVKEPEKVRQQIGFLTSELKLDTHFTAEYTMDYFGRLYGMSKAQIKKRTEDMFEVFGIKEFKNTKIEELSTGMKQKLSIAVSLVHDPSVIIFDEPTNGLDIITARSVTDYLKKMRDEGKLIIISTHIMDVAQKLCDSIGIILKGKIRALGTLEEICKQTNTKNLEDAFFELYSAYEKEGENYV